MNRTWIRLRAADKLRKMEGKGNDTRYCVMRRNYAKLVHRLVFNDFLEKGIDPWRRSCGEIAYPHKNDWLWQLAEKVINENSR